MNVRLALPALLVACANQSLDAGVDVPRGLLPVDERNALILSNDGTGNWYGLYSVLFANAGGPSLAGIVVNASRYATNLDDNLSAWQALVTAARASGLGDIPDPTASTSVPLTRPTDGDIAATLPNGSDGARLILDLSSRLALPHRPVVVATGSRLTDVADAYLLDPSVTERVIVVAALGSGSQAGAVMGAPNGELDPWADWIVTQRFRYIQVSAYYDVSTDLPPSELADLPMNPLGAFVAAQQPNITSAPTQADQVSVLAVGVPKFVTRVERVALDPAGEFDANIGPTLLPNENGRHWLVLEVDASLAGARLREMLGDPRTFGQ